MKRTVIGAVLSVAAVAAVAADAVLMFFSPSASVSTASGGNTSSTRGGNGNGGSGSTGGGNGGSGSTGDQTSGGYADGTYTGRAISTQHGNVQLSVTISSGRISSIEAVAYPNREPRSEMISQQAIPMLTDQAISAQSADIQMVAGATDTSSGFIGSLQDALNQAGRQ